MTQQSAYVSTVVTSDREVRQVILGMLALMASNAGASVVDQGPPANLLFRDEATLNRYRGLMGSMLAAIQREQESPANFTQAQTDRAARVGALLKR